MRLYLLFLFTMLSFYELSAQKGTVLLGTDTYGASAYYKDPQVDTTFTSSLFGFMPYLGYGISKDFTLGLTGAFNSINIDNYEKSTYTGIGLFAKYIYQPKISPKKRLLSRIGFPVTLSGMVTNYYELENQINFVDNPFTSEDNQLLLQSSVGFNIRVFRNAYIQWTYAPRWFVDKSIVHDLALSFEYRFGGDYKDEASPKLTWPERDKTKRAFAKTVVIGSSIAGIFDTGADDEFNYWDLSWSKNVAINLTNKFYLGINHTNIWATDLATDSEHKSTITGIYTQYDMTKAGDKFKALVELGYYVGNHCTCGALDGNPQRSDELLSYLGWGVGLEHRFAKQFSLDFMWNVTLILNKDVEDRYAHVMPNIGLNYYIGSY